jgi:hypothetical protein
VFDFLKKKPAKPRLEIRDALFGDLPLASFLDISPQALASEPWASFVRASQCLDSGDTPAAIEVLQQVLQLPRLEPRFYLQAWHFLRDSGVNPPPEKAKELLGVVVEVGMPKGLDLVAAYPDHCARYYNFSGAGVVWEKPSDQLDGAIDDLLEKGAAVLARIGPWDGSRPDAPPNGQVRINLLTPSGLHFGQGPMNAISKDPMGGPVLRSAFNLMQELIKVAKDKGQTH